MLDINNEDFLTREQIAKIAPTVFASNPSPDVSKHYTHIPTSTILEDMEKLGWGVVDAQEVRSRTPNTKGFQKHLLVFRNNDIVINGEDGDTVFPQILLTNSHDGKNAFTFQAGLFRMICSNGLVVSTQDFENVKMRHMGYTFEDLQENIHEMVNRLPLTVESMNKMKSTILSEPQKVDFAKNALKSRFSDQELNRIEINLEKLLNPVRREDVGDDLWSVFNVVQEKIIEGDFDYTFGTKSRKARRIKNFQQDQKINTKLFSTALEYAS